MAAVSIGSYGKWIKKALTAEAVNAFKVPYGESLP
jgi:hypothetical protein